MEVLETVYLAQDNVADIKVLPSYRDHGAKLPGLDLAGHGVATRSELDGLTVFQFFNIWSGPAHIEAILLNHLPGT